MRHKKSPPATANNSATSKGQNKSASSKRWLQEHFSDVYVKRAQQEGVRARSVYKLREINERYRIIKSGMTIVDLGAAPGSWTEYAARIVGQQGKVVAMDILPIDPIAPSKLAGGVNNITYLQGDFTHNVVVGELQQIVGRGAVDVVLSDMAPNTCGIKEVDQARSLELVYTAFLFARQTLKAHGAFLVKVFQSQGVASFTQELHANFRDVKAIKPEASRSRSQEIFLLALDLR